MCEKKNLRTTSSRRAREKIFSWSEFKGSQGILQLTASGCVKCQALIPLFFNIARALINYILRSENLIKYNLIQLISEIRIKLFENLILLKGFADTCGTIIAYSQLKMGVSIIRVNFNNFFKSVNCN